MLCQLALQSAPVLQLFSQAACHQSWDQMHRFSSHVLNKSLEKLIVRLCDNAAMRHAISNASVNALLSSCVSSLKCCLVLSGGSTEVAKSAATSLRRSALDFVGASYWTTSLPQVNPALPAILALLTPRLGALLSSAQCKLLEADKAIAILETVVRVSQADALDGQPRLPFGLGLRYFTSIHFASILQVAVRHLSVHRSTAPTVDIEGRREAFGTPSGLVDSLNVISLTNVLCNFSSSLLSPLTSSADGLSTEISNNGFSRLLLRSPILDIVILHCQGLYQVCNLSWDNSEGIRSLSWDNSEGIRSLS